jgi:hypothetical protein
MGRIERGGGSGGDPVRSPPGRHEVSPTEHRASGHVIWGRAGIAEIRPFTSRPAGIQVDGRNTFRGSGGFDFRLENSLPVEARLHMRPLAAGVGLIAFTFALLAAFWALSSFLPQWQAALVIASIALLAALILRFAGLSLIRRRTPVQRMLGFKPGATLPQASVPAAQTKAPVEPLTLVLVAALAGIALGRRLSK